MKERLSRYMARSGVASRRKAEDLIKSGRVRVNGKRILEPFFAVDGDLDTILFDNKPVSRSSRERQYLALHKPRGFISDLADPQGRPLARDLLKTDLRLYPVGRLDFNSEGLILFTDDGDFAQRIMHPKNAIEKEYLVKVQKPLTPDQIATLTTGLRLDGVLYRLDAVRLARMARTNAWYAMVATSGRNRLIRRLLEALGHQVLRLRRTRIGPISLGNLPPGAFRYLTPGELRHLVPSPRESKGSSE